jgi:hypothetical protein
MLMLELAVLTVAVCSMPTFDPLARTSRTYGTKTHVFVVLREVCWRWRRFGSSRMRWNALEEVPTTCRFLEHMAFLVCTSLQLFTSGFCVDYVRIHGVMMGTSTPRHQSCSNRILSSPNHSAI